MKRYFLPALALSLLAAPAFSATIAYWRFEEGPANSTLLGNAGDSNPGSFTTTADQTGNNPLRTWNSNPDNGLPLTAPKYSTNVPNSTITSSSAPNLFSFACDGNDDLYTDSQLLTNHTFSQFTIEASVKFDTLDGYQTFVGKDGNHIPGSATWASAGLYFQLVHDGGHDNTVAIKTHQANGAEIGTYTANPISAGIWYSFAAVMDGNTLSLYSLKSDGSYAFESSVPFSGPMFLQDRTWTVGRGMWEGNVNDWTKGNIDEVRISDTALTPNQFLFAAVPEPASLAILALASTALVTRRRR